MGAAGPQLSLPTKVRGGGEGEEEGSGESAYGVVIHEACCFAGKRERPGPGPVTSASYQSGHPARF